MAQNEATGNVQESAEAAASSPPAASPPPDERALEVDVSTCLSLLRRDRTNKLLTWSRKLQTQIQHTTNRKHLQPSELRLHNLG